MFLFQNRLRKRFNEKNYFELLSDFVFLIFKILTWLDFIKILVMIFESLRFSLKMLHSFP
jgi:hypothetical protein